MFYYLCSLGMFIYQLLSTKTRHLCIIRDLWYIFNNFRVVASLNNINKVCLLNRSGSQKLWLLWYFLEPVVCLSLVVWWEMNIITLVVSYVWSCAPLLCTDVGFRHCPCSHFIFSLTQSERTTLSDCLSHWSAAKSVVLVSQCSSDVFSDLVFEYPSILSLPLSLYSLPSIFCWALKWWWCIVDCFCCCAACVWMQSWLHYQLQELHHTVACHVIPCYSCSMVACREIM